MYLRLKLHCKRLRRGGHKKREKKKMRTKAKQKKNLCMVISHTGSDKSLHLNYLLTGGIYWKTTMQQWVGNREVLIPLWKTVFLSFSGVVFVAVTNLHICFYKVSPVSENYFMLPCYYTNKMKSKFLHDVTCKPFALK